LSTGLLSANYTSEIPPRLFLTRLTSSDSFAGVTHVFLTFTHVVEWFVLWCSSMGNQMGDPILKKLFFVVEGQITFFLA